MQKSGRHGTQEKLFKTAIILKGINGVLELIGGLLLLFVGTRRINHLIDMLTQGQLQDSPHSILMKIATKDGVIRHVGAVHFAVLYLLVNGIVKLFIVAALMKHKVKLFPYSMAFLGIFVVYGVSRLFSHPSIWLGLAMFLDVVIIVLIGREYRDLKSQGD